MRSFSGYVQDSGEGRWTVEAAIEEAVPADVLTAALFARFRSRQEHTFGEKMLSAMRFGFGGHVEGQDRSTPRRKPKIRSALGRNRKPPSSAMLTRSDPDAAGGAADRLPPGDRRSRPIPARW